MSLSYTVGSKSNARTRAPGRNLGQKHPNVKPPGSSLQNSPSNRAGKLTVQQTLDKSEFHSSKTKSLSQQSVLENHHGSRIVTLSDLNLNDDKSTELKSKRTPTGTSTGRTPAQPHDSHVSLPPCSTSSSRCGNSILKNSAFNSRTNNPNANSSLNRIRNLHTTSATKSSANSPSRNMSYTGSNNTTSRTQRTPSYSSSTGRPTHRQNMPPETDPAARRNQQQPEPGEPVYNPDGCYTGIAPNQAKRNKMQSMASKEEHDYKRYKEQKRVCHVSIAPSTVGGARTSEEETRLKQQREHKQKKYERYERQEESKRRTREERDRESAEIKKRGRAQAEKNKRQAEEEQRRKQRSLGSDRRRSNEAFLKRLEQQ